MNYVFCSNPCGFLAKMYVIFRKLFHILPKIRPNVFWVLCFFKELFFVSLQCLLVIKCAKFMSVAFTEARAKSTHNKHGFYDGFCHCLKERRRNRHSRSSSTSTQSDDASCHTPRIESDENDIAAFHQRIGNTK